VDHYSIANIQTILRTYSREKVVCRWWLFTGWIFHIAKIIPCSSNFVWECGSLRLMWKLKNLYPRIPADLIRLDRLPSNHPHFLLNRGQMSNRSLSPGILITLQGFSSFVFATFLALRKENRKWACSARSLALLILLRRSIPIVFQHWPNENRVPTLTSMTKRESCFPHRYPCSTEIRQKPEWTA